MEAIIDTNSEQLEITSHGTRIASKELQALHKTLPLAEIAKPLIAKTLEGIRGMAKIVGSATPVEKITPDLLAAAAQIKEQTDNEIMLPIIELNEHLRAKKQEIVVMFNNQVAQLDTLRATVTKLQLRESSIAEKLEIIDANAESLVKRSASVLQSAHDLQPTITQAEFDYFQELRRLHDRTQQWRGQLDRLKSRATTLRDNAEHGADKGKMEIPAETKKNLNAMLNASESRLKKYSTRLKDAEYRIDELAEIAGWERDPHGTVGVKQ